MAGKVRKVWGQGTDVSFSRRKGKGKGKGKGSLLGRHETRGKPRQEPGDWNQNQKQNQVAGGRCKWSPVGSEVASLLSDKPNNPFNSKATRREAKRLPASSKSKHHLAQLLHVQSPKPPLLDRPFRPAQRSAAQAVNKLPFAAGAGAGLTYQARPNSSTLSTHNNQLPHLLGNFRSFQTHARLEDSCLIMAQKRLMQELQPLQKEKWVNIETDDSNLLIWKIGLWVVNPDSVWHGAYLRAEMKFPNDYPYQPPSFKFLTKNICHPNVYTDGNLCISILHKPGEDEQSGELASERWNVLHGVESVLRSVLLLLDDPEINSPANVDASVLYRDNKTEYNKRAKDIVDKSQKDIPSGSRMPTPSELAPAPQKPIDDDADFWNMTDEEEDFGGSDSDEDMEDFDDDDEDDDDVRDQK
nr:hypothetical protein FVER53263_04802 [Fusarium verticillioides]